MSVYNKIKTAGEPEHMMWNEVSTTRDMKFQREKERLESMVKKFFDEGNVNMGEDMNILRQSSILDEIVVALMLQ